MTYTPFPFSSFGAGLNLRDKSDAVREDEAIDALNIYFTERGAVRQRDGYGSFKSAMTNAADSLFPHYESDGTKQLLAGCGTRLEAISTSGAIVASDTGLTTGTWAFARFGGPSAEVTYAVNGKNAARKWDGSAWAAAGNIGKPRYIAYTGAEDSARLVGCGYDSGANGPSGAANVNPSRVHFSDAGTPETWTAANYVDLSPGDGEKIQGVIAYRDELYVFKETKFFIFYGESTDSAGNPIFNYRAVEGGVGLAAPRALCAHATGIYFMGRDGIYQTTGGEPRLVSELIGPVFSGAASTFYLGGALLHSQITNSCATFHRERLYVAFTSSGTANNRVLVYDPTYEWWSLYDFAARSLTSFRISSEPELCFGDTTNRAIYRHAPGYLSDDGTAITSRWRSGWFDMGSSDNKTVREIKVWGTGTVDLGLGSDYADPTSTSFALAASTSSGPNSPSTVANVADAGINVWANPSNATSSNNTYASITDNTGFSGSDWLQATNFGFSIPSGATILGVVVGVERKSTSATASTGPIKLVKAGSITGDDNSTTVLWTSTDTYEDYGGATDLWGLGLTPADVNASDFGVALQVSGTAQTFTSSVDHIRMTIYYVGVPAPVIARGLSARGTVFSTSISNDTLDQPWSVHRLALHLREFRVASVRHTDT